jgi:hypothetical protein
MFLTIHELYRAPGSPREFRVGTDGDAFVLFTAVMKASGIEYDSLVMSQVAPDVHIATIKTGDIEIEPATG